MYSNATVSQPGLMGRVLPGVFGVLLALFSNTVTAGTHFEVTEARVTLVEKVYYLDARIDYELSESLMEVLHKGVRVVLVLDIEFEQHRKYLWNETVAQLEQRYQLEYHALTRQYLVTNLNSGSQHSFPTLDVALSKLGTVVDLPVLDEQLIDDAGDYIGLIRASVDVSELPTPLRLRAYFSADWHLTSEWYSWTLPN